MSIRYQVELHNDLLQGHKIAIGWGISADIRLQLLRAPYRFSYLVDGLKTSIEASFFSDIEVLSPLCLKRFDPEQYVVVVFADPHKFGCDIQSRCEELGVLHLTLPYSSWQHLPKPQLQLQLNSFLKCGRQPALSKSNVVLLWLHMLGSGGAEWQMVLLAIGLTQLGKEVHLVTAHGDTDSTSDWSARLLKAGVKRHALLPIRQIDLDEVALGAGIDLFAPQYYLQIIQTEELIRSICPEIAIGFLDGGNTVLGMAAKRAGHSRVIMSARSLAPDNMPHFDNMPANFDGMKLIYRTLLAEPEFTMTNNSERGAESYLTWLDMEANSTNSAVIQNAIQSEKFVPVSYSELLNVSPNKIVIGAVMRLTHEKRPDRFVSITEKLLKKVEVDAEIVLIGDGALKSEVEQQIQATGMPERYHLLGNVEQGLAYIAGMDLLLLTSDVEGTPNVLMEAQLAKIKFVAPDIGGIKEAVYPELIEGFLVSTTEEHLFFDACLRLLSSGKHLDYLVQKAHDWISQRSAEKTAQKYLNLFS